MAESPTMGWRGASIQRSFRMIMADVLTYTLLILGAIVVLNSYWLVAASLAPALVERASVEYRRPLLVTGLGIVAILPFIGLVAALRGLNHPAGNLVSIFVIAVPVVFGLIGSSGLARRIGGGLASSADAQQPWRRILRGGIAFALTMLLPFIGWFLVLPWALISGFGAAVLALRGVQKDRAPAGLDGASMAACSSPGGSGAVPEPAGTPSHSRE